MGNYRHFLIFLVLFLWPALTYAHGGLEAFMLKLAVVFYIISAVISLYILRPCPRIVWLVGLIFSITSAIVFPLMFYTDWWKFAHSALLVLTFWMPLIALLIRFIYVLKRKYRKINSSERQ